MKKITWWHFGILGLFTLLGATILGAPVKLIARKFRHPEDEIPWHQLPLFLLAICGMGFACGVVAWLVWRVARNLGAVGHAIVGVVVMVFFFFLCMLLFDQDLLFDPYRALPMWIMGVVVGIVLGLWVGNDLRKGHADHG